MKIFIAGTFSFPIYETAFADSLAGLGHDVHRFAWLRYFAGVGGKAQAYFPLPGPALLRLNRELARQAVVLDPDLLLVWRGTHVLPRTLKRIRERTHTTIALYNNDDPFSQIESFRWYWCNRSYPFADLSLFFRQINVVEARRAGAQHAAIMMPYFVPARDRPIVLSKADRDRFGCDAVFIGHYEPDGRENYLKALVRAGLHVRLFGGKDWTPRVLGDATAHFGNVQPVMGDDYPRALRAARMCLCFLSRRNRDVYTSRCFEIPACGALLLSERTDELRALFREDEEAVYFSTPDELVVKARWLRDHPEEATRIAEAGRRRVLAGGHSIDDRARQFMTQVEGVRRSIPVRAAFESRMLGVARG